MGRVRASRRVVVTLDPAARRCGVAVSVDGELVRALTVRTREYDPADLALRVLVAVGPKERNDRRQWVAEDPQDYRESDATTRNLDTLRAVIGAVDQIIAPSRCRLIRPHAWKGNVPKQVHHTRIARFLTPHERAAMLDQAEDTWDALGLNLYVLRRTGRGGTRPRE